MNLEFPHDPSQPRPRRDPDERYLLNTSDGVQRVIGVSPQETLRRHIRGCTEHAFIELKVVNPTVEEYLAVLQFEFSMGRNAVPMRRSANEPAASPAQLLQDLGSINESGDYFRICKEAGDWTLLLHACYPGKRSRSMLAHHLDLTTGVRAYRRAQITAPKDQDAIVPALRDLAEDFDVFAACLRTAYRYLRAG